MPNRAFDAVFFDCDGVLVDSEPITNEVLHTMLQELGWNLSKAECLTRFVGKSFLDEAPVILEHTGVQIDQEWIVGFRRRRDDALREQLQPVTGAAAAVRFVAEHYGSSFACVSGADRGKIEMQLSIAGLTELFDDRVFSGMEMPRSKPAPDVYLAAARALRVDPARSVVIEDSLSGVQAGIAAGATVLGFAADGPSYRTAAELLSAGATATFSDMQQLPNLL